MKSLFERRVLALSVHAQRFGFAVFDGPYELIDWGARNFRGGVNAVKMPMEAKVMLLCDTYRPDVLILNEPRRQQGRTAGNIVAQLARTERIPVTSVPWKAVRECFPADQESKYHIAAAIAVRYPELLPRLPSRRKAWQSEKYGITLFEAVALGIVYFSDPSTKP